MTEDGFIPLSRRLTGAGPLSDAPFEGVPEHLYWPVQEWLQAQFNDAPGVELARRIALRMHIPAQPPARAGLPPDYVTALGVYGDEGEEAILDLVDATLQLNPRRPPEEAMEAAIRAGGHPWLRVVRDLDSLLRAGGSAYEVNMTLQRLERRVDASVREAFAAAVEQAEAAGRQRAGERLREAWAAAYGRDPRPSEAVHDSARAVEAAIIPLVEPANRKATLGTVLAILSGPAGRNWKMALVQDRAGVDAGIAPLLGLLKIIWHNHHDRHEGNQPAAEVTAQTAQAVVHAAALVVQWTVSGVVLEARPTEPLHEEPVPG